MTPPAQIHSIVSRVGWICLFLATGLPLLFSLTVIATSRNTTCTTNFYLSYAPLMLACEPVAIGEVVLGWALTITSIAALGVGFGAAIYFLCIVRRQPARRFELMHFACTFLVSAIGAGLVLLADPDSLWGRGSWIFFCSATGLAVGLISVFGGGIRGMMLRNGT